ncbi:hypothetical protein AB3R30_22130 [Leptolyngbyaceae cyanobacterium UHCC 1019]
MPIFEQSQFTIHAPPFAKSLLWAKSDRPYNNTRCATWSSYLSHAIAVMAICIIAWQVLLS